MFLFFNLVKLQTFGILINTSRGFQNYRHMTDLFLMYSNLIKNKVDPSNIVCYFPEDIFLDKRNISKERVFITEKETLQYKKLISKGFTTNDILNGLRGNIPEFKYISSEDNVIIYIIGHGCEGTLKFYSKDWLTKEDLMRNLKILSQRVNKIFFILDTCEAESIVSRDINNMFILTTSKYQEPSVSYDKSDLLGVFTIDEFPYFFERYFKGFLKRNTV